MLATLFADAKRFAEADQELQQVLAASPGDYSACFLLGMINWEQENFDVAADWFGKALASNPTAESARVAQERCQQRQPFP